MNAPRFNSGFSLMEVLVAILILGVALVGLTQAVTLSLQSSKESEQQTSAALVAAGVIETLRAEGNLLDGTTEGGNDSYHWKQTLSRTAIDGLHEVEVSVENAKSGKLIFELRTLLFERPEDASPAKTGNGKKSSASARRSG